MGSFDQFLDDEANTKGPQKPFWSLDFENDDELLRWLNQEIRYLKEQAEERFLNQRKNLAVYRGIQYQAQDRRGRDEFANDNTIKRRTKNPRIIYNHMVDMVEQDVSRMTKYRGAVSAEPASEENKDRLVAKASEELIEAFWDKIDIDNLIQKHVRRKRIFSDDFVGVFWNKNLGPYDPTWLSEVFKKAGIPGNPKQMTSSEIRQIFRTKLKNIPKLPVLDPDTGEPVVVNGKPLTIDRPMRLGDIDIRLMFSWDVFMQRRMDYADSEYGAYRERVPCETLQAMHPKHAKEIANDPNSQLYEPETLEEAARREEVEVFHFYHRSTDLLDSGRYIKFTRSAILINKPNPYVGWDDRAILPWARTVDIDTPGVLNGDSIVTFGRSCQAVYNNIMSLHVRNMFLYAHPKWFMPRGAAKLESLGNDTTVVQYKGQVPPVLAQPNLANQGMDAVATRAKEDMQQIMGVYGVSRGEPPTGVTAAVALTFLDEQESERANIGVAGLMRTLRNIGLQCLWLMADHYGDDEGRLESILGKTKLDEIAAFKMSDLRNIGDLKIQNASALPQQKAARLQYILDLKEKFPGAVPDETAIDLLDLGEIDKLRSIITVAVRKSAQENDVMLNGKPASPPEKQEYHLVHYRAHIRAMNEPYYCKLPPPVKKNYEEHVSATEMFLLDQGMKNPQMAAAIVAEFPGFPYFYRDPMPDLLPAMMPPPGVPNEPAGAPMGPPPVMPGPGPQVIPSTIGQQDELAPGAEAQTPPPAGQNPGAEATSPSSGAPV